MKKILLILTLFLFTLNSFSQKKDIEFKTDKKRNSITFICINNSNTKQEVTLTFPKIKGLKGYRKPIKKIVAPKSQTPFITLTSKGRYSYSTSYNYKAYFSKEDQKILEEKLKKKQEEQDKIIAEKLKTKELKDISKLKKGIVVFSKKGCSRCKVTNDYLITNNIDYTYLNTTNNIKYNRLMWSMLKENNFKGKSVLMPVILVDGKLFTNFKNLKGFLTTLKNK